MKASCGQAIYLYINKLGTFLAIYRVYVLPSVWRLISSKVLGLHRKVLSFVGDIYVKSVGPYKLVCSLTRLFYVARIHTSYRRQPYITYNVRTSIHDGDLVHNIYCYTSTSQRPVLKRPLRPVAWFVTIFRLVVIVVHHPRFVLHEDRKRYSYI